MNLRNILYKKYSRILECYLNRESLILELESVLLGPEKYTHPSELLRGRYSLYVSTDLSNQIRALKETKSIECVVTDSKRLPFKSGSFDLIHTTFPARVAEFRFKNRMVHPTFSEKCLSTSIDEALQVLKEGGAFLIFPFFTDGDEFDETWQTRVIKEFERRGFGVKEEEMYTGHAVAIFYR
jgi:hypothetical protein